MRYCSSTNKRRPSDMEGRGRGRSTTGRVTATSSQRERSAKPSWASQVQELQHESTAKGKKMTVRTQQQDGGMGNSKSSAGNLVSLVVWLGYNLPVMKAVGRALRRIPPPPTYAVNRALGGGLIPGLCLPSPRVTRFILYTVL